MTYTIKITCGHAFGAVYTVEAVDMIEALLVVAKERSDPTRRDGIVTAINNAGCTGMITNEKVTYD